MSAVSCSSTNGFECAGLALDCHRRFRYAGGAGGTLSTQRRGLPLGGKRTSVLRRRRPNPTRIQLGHVSYGAPAGGAGTSHSVYTRQSTQWIGRSGFLRIDLSGGVEFSIGPSGPGARLVSDNAAPGTRRRSSCTIGNSRRHNADSAPTRCLHRRHRL